MYRITDWDLHYENSRSRQIKDCQWVPIPNKQDGLGYNKLVTEHKNGAAHYGIWMAIVCICSRQKERSGCLTDNGAPHGNELTPHDIALISRLPEKLIKEALPRFVEIGWAETNKKQPPVTSLPQGDGSLPPNRIEGKGIEEKKEAPKPTATKPYDERVDVYFESISPNMITMWEKAYPNVAIVEQLPRAQAWLRANHKQAKRNFGRFVNNWLARAMDKYNGSGVHDGEAERTAREAEERSGEYTPPPADFMDKVNESMRSDT